MKPYAKSATQAVSLAAGIELSFHSSYQPLLTRSTKTSIPQIYA
jgi:hypothetical protein